MRQPPFFYWLTQEISVIRPAVRLGCLTRLLYRLTQEISVIP